MSIITISRGTYSGGQALAEQVAERLGYRCVCREEILKAAARTYGYPTDKLESEMDSAPSFWDRLSGVRSKHQIFVQAALLESARRGPMVYHGYVGHLHLVGLPHVLRVRVIADLEYRVRAIMGEHHTWGAVAYTRESALAQIKKADIERRDWVRFLFGVEWDDPSMYDLVLNIGRMSLESACDVVAQVAEREEFRQTIQSSKALEDLTLGSRVSAALLADSQTATSDVKVSADSGVVTLEGSLRGRDSEDSVLAVVRGVEGVRSVRNELTSVHLLRGDGEY